MSSNSTAPRPQFVERISRIGAGMACKSKTRFYCQRNPRGGAVRVVPTMLFMLMIIIQIGYVLGQQLEIITTEEQEQGEQYLRAHNAARQEVGVGIPDLVWDPVLYLHASDWAEFLAGEGCVRLLSDGPYGENILWSRWLTRPADIVGYWLQEKRHYHANDNTCDYEEDCSQYTQMVWRATEKLGCGSARCDDDSWIHVCNYDPPGNYGGMPYQQTLWADN
ncbi:hypothetical protein R1flu_004252 [Riccia fluitans]|uniref:SCP domain-containing protein n=1 Tax=Riccia fluitans TaxID=41844 RepID=A0ABD1YQ18_9MARC